MISAEEWAKFKGDEQLNMYVALSKRIEVLESCMRMLIDAEEYCMRMLIDAEEYKLKALRIRMNK